MTGRRLLVLSFFGLLSWVFIICAVVGAITIIKTILN
jgi:uncharacterized membrane protein